MSNSRAEIAQFVARYDSICKSFSPFTEGSGVDQRVFYTRRLSAADVEALDPVLGVPLIVQERIEKSYEVRAAFVDGRAYCLKIPGDYESSGSVDWREQPFSSLETVPVELPAETTQRCLSLLDRFSLKMASLDFIVDRDDKLWFLELNEQGNFLFLDRVYGESRVLGAFCDMVTGPLGLVGKEVSACLPETMLERVGALFNGEHKSDPNSFFRRLGCAQ
jgi:hypothetical protein